MAPPSASQLLSVFRGQLRIPLSRLRAATGAAPIELELEDASPCLRVKGVANALGADIRFATRVELDGLRHMGAQRLLTLRFYDTSADVADDAPGPLAATLRAGGIDLSRPGDRIAAQVGLPDFIVRAAGNELCLDLTRLPFLQGEERRGWLALARVGTSAISVSRARVIDDCLELHFKLLPQGGGGLARALVAEAVLPRLQRWATATAEETP